jgi:DnaJ like chaperone protein
MAKFGKWLVGGLGWAVGGPIGAIIGFALGSVFDDTKVLMQGGSYGKTTQIGDFSASLLVLAAAVMKADGSVLKSELEYVKKFFVKNFGAAHTQEQMLVFRELLKKEIPVREVCMQIRQNMEHAARLQLIHFLFGVSSADGAVHLREVEVIAEIAGYLGVNDADFNSLKAMFFKDSESDFKILEIPKSASDDEVKKAYRKMAVKFHPDKVSHLGEDIQIDAKEKFQKVQAAYENIKKQRGFN